MARGSLSGLIWGGVVALGGAAVISLGTPQPQAPSVAATDPTTSAPAEMESGTALPEATAPASVAEQPASPSAPQADTVAALEDTAPAAAPVVGAVAPLADTTVPDSDTPRVPAQTDPAQEPAPRATAPEAPEPDDLATEPTAPAPPPVADAPDAPAVAAEADPAPTVTARLDPAPQATAPTGQGAPEPGSEPQADTAPNVPTQPASDAPVEQSTPAETDPAPAPRIAALPRVQTETPDASAEAEPEAAPSGPSIGQRVIPLTERQNAGTALPAITDAATAPEAQAPQDPAPDQPPLIANAALFENPEAKPLMSIVLIDDATAIGAEALANFPYPLSFAIDPADPQAAQKMARHRAAGFEVLALVDLPAEATAQDAETTLAAGFATLSEVVGVLEGLDGGIQGNRALSDQVTAILRDQGYGLVTQNSGLNTVQKLAVREGVAADVVFRDFDGAGQTPTVMRRFLDQAAFRAGQEGGVIMLGRVQPDTISALLLWGLQDRASRVTLAPVSAVLRQADEVE